MCTRWQVRVTLCYCLRQYWISTRFPSIRKVEKFKRAWNNYSLAVELNKKSEAIQVATLLTVITCRWRSTRSIFDVHWLSFWRRRLQDRASVSQSKSTASHGKMFHLSNIVSTATSKKQARHMISIALHSGSWARGVNLQQSLLIRYFEIDLCLAFRTPRPERDCFASPT